MAKTSYKPYEEFLEREKTNESANLWKTAKKLMSFRLCQLEYSSKDYNFSGCYIIDALMEASGTLGVEIATALSILIKTEVSEKKIICMDIINPNQMPVPIYQSNVGWSTDKPEKIALFEDERYLVGIENDEDDVRIYLFKK